MLSAYIVRKSEGKYQGAAEAARGFVKAKVLRIDRPLAGGFLSLTRLTARRLWWRLCRKFYKLLRSGGGRPEIWGAPLTIEPENRAFGARGKHANQAAPVGNAPLLPTASLHGKASHEIFSRLMAPYKFSSLATPEGEICSPLALGPHKHNKALRR